MYNIATYGKPIWTYVDVVRGPVAGPQPRLAKGSGRTGGKTGGTGANMPGYMSSSDYEINQFSYGPPTRESYGGPVARSIGASTNGREVVGTYEPHTSLIGTRFLHQMRSAANWQVQEYPPNYRNTLQWQQVQKYRVESIVRSAKPLPKSNYFLGYEMNPDMIQQFGQNKLGYLGS